MSSCKLNHSLEDVRKKLLEQHAFLLESIYKQCEKFLLLSPTQTQLNELFHLLKKYDLASDEEKLERNEKLVNLVNQ
jgi:hypothetical protein